MSGPGLPPLTGRNGQEVRLARGGISHAAYRFLRTLAVGVALVYWRIEVLGAERLPEHGGFVLAPVHRSNIDFLLPALAVRRRVRWMAKHTIFTGGWVDRFLVAMGAFPVNRDRPDRGALSVCEALLDGGDAVVMFPEGRRKEGPEVLEVFAGPAFCAARQRLPVVPMGIAGSDNVMPIGSKFVRPAKVVVVVGEPIYPDVAVEGRVPRRVVDEFTEQIRLAVQDCYDEAKARLGRR